MGISELKYDGKVFVSERDIIRILKENEFYWLLDSEVEVAKIEITKNTLIWKEGVYLYGKWYYGIFENGTFNGIWENGIWVDGTFKGEWKSGMNKPN